MNLTRLLTVLAAGSLVAACESGDINIAPVNNTDNSIGDGNIIGSGGGNAACAKCHYDPARPKTRAAATECAECHRAEDRGEYAELGRCAATPTARYRPG